MRYDRRVNRAIAAALSLVIGSLAGACYAPSFADCALTCSAGMTCPDGQACDGEFCRGPKATGTCDSIGMIDASMGSEGSSTADTDNDGVTDDVDNCRTIRNMFQDNEDGDEFGDACDPCPPLGPPNNADGDLDGVGIGCDPNPNTSGDSIALFEGFERTPLNPMIVKTGTMSFSNGQMVILGNNNTPAYMMWPVQSQVNRVVSARFRVDSLVAAPSTLGVADRVSIVANSGVACESGLGAAGPELSLYDLPNTRRSSGSIAIGNGQTYGLAMRRMGSTWNCQFLPAGQQTATNSPTNETIPDTFAGFRARNAGASVDWVMIVNIP